MSKMRGHIAKRSCAIHGDNGCEVQGDAGSITRSEEKRQTARESREGGEVSETGFADMNDGQPHDVGFFEVVDTQLWGWRCPKCKKEQTGLESLAEAELEAGFYHSS